MAIHNFKVGQTYLWRGRNVKVEALQGKRVWFSGLDGLGFCIDKNGHYPFLVVAWSNDHDLQLIEDALHDVYFFDSQELYITVARSAVKDLPWSYAINGVTRYALQRLSASRDEAMEKGLEEAERFYQERLKTNKLC